MLDELTMTPAAERVLDVAGKLFYENGIHAVGVESIATEAGVTKKTLYDRFGSKDTLVSYYLHRRDERWREHLRAYVERSSRISAQRRLLLAFDALEDWINTENPRGCAFINAQAELTDPGHPGREVIREQKQWMMDLLRAMARQAGARNTRRLATSLFVLLEGATVTASLGIVPGAVGNAKDVAKRLIEQDCAS